MTKNKGNFLTLFRTIAANARDAVSDCIWRVRALHRRCLTAHRRLAEGPRFHRGAHKCRAEIIPVEPAWVVPAKGAKLKTHRP